LLPTSYELIKDRHPDRFATLEQFDLQDLISDLPRPNENAPSYAKWRKHSKMVRTWFISAIYNDLLTILWIAVNVLKVEYADEFLRKIRKIMISSGHRIMAHIQRNLNYALQR
jgi:hypothetical protein